MGALHHGCDASTIPHAPAGASAWNCKPHALKPLLAAGYREVVWLDFDIIGSRDCRRLFTTLDDRVFAIAQEPAMQGRAWLLMLGTVSRPREIEARISARRHRKALALVAAVGC